MNFLVDISDLFDIKPTKKRRKTAKPTRKSLIKRKALDAQTKKRLSSAQSKDFFMCRGVKNDSTESDSDD